MKFNRNPFSSFVDQLWERSDRPQLSHYAIILFTLFKAYVAAFRNPFIPARKHTGSTKLHRLTSPLWTPHIACVPPLLNVKWNVGVGVPLCCEPEISLGPVERPSCDDYRPPVRILKSHFPWLEFELATPQRSLITEDIHTNSYPTDWSITTGIYVLTLLWPHLFVASCCS